MAEFSISKVLCLFAFSSQQEQPCEPKCFVARRTTKLLRCVDLSSTVMTDLEAVMSDLQAVMTDLEAVMTDLEAVMTDLEGHLGVSLSSLPLLAAGTGLSVSCF